MTEDELEQIINEYIFTHRADDSPMDKSLEDLKNSAIERSKNNVE